MGVGRPDANLNLDKIFKVVLKLTQNFSLLLKRHMNRKVSQMSEESALFWMIPPPRTLLHVFLKNPLNS